MSSITCSIILQIIIVISIIAFILKCCKVNDKNGCLATIIFILLIILIPLPTWLGLPITLWFANLIELFGEWISSNITCIIIPILLLFIFGGSIAEFIGNLIEDIQVFGIEGIFKSIKGKKRNKVIGLVVKKTKEDTGDILNNILTEKKAKELFSNDSYQITISNNFTSIGNNALKNYTSLKSIKILEGVTSIGNNAFENCTSLENISIPESITEIGMLAFSGCKSLSKIKIPDSVTKIGYCAFEDIDTIYYNGSAEGSPWGAENHKKYRKKLVDKEKKSKNKQYKENKN